jgi:glutamate synthase domain-containing protein 2
MLEKISRFSRYSTLVIVALLALCFALLSISKPYFVWLLLLFGGLLIIGIGDLVQTRHSLWRNYPILSHCRWLVEGIRPEIRQYLFESDVSGTPFNREQRSLVYQRAKGESDKVPFGTELDVYDEEYAWLNHSTAPKAPAEQPFRIEVGAGDCRQPYSASVFNVSAMSFGSVSANAVLALNEGARRGSFAHDTGEGGVSRYHLEPGGDLIWEIGSGYFGCRAKDGGFDADMFADQAAVDAVKMIEIKLSQGAKPGHGGVLPGTKVTAEIAQARGISIGETCESPASHSAFSTPTEMMEFVALLRERAAGKPIGLKLCIGHRWEFMAMCKGMLSTGIKPDFIVIDGSEGGTGAAPLEFSDHIGSPLRVGLQFAQNALVGAGLRDHIRLGASGKVVSAFDMVRAMCLGADWCNSARGFMFALGCIQSQSCHTNRCPVGLATQDSQRQGALVVADKSSRVFQFHETTMRALAEIIGAAGLEHPAQLRPEHFYIHSDSQHVTSFRDTFTWLESGELLAGNAHPKYAAYWKAANPDSFAPT